MSLELDRKGLKNGRSGHVVASFGRAPVGDVLWLVVVELSSKQKVE